MLTLIEVSYGSGKTLLATHTARLYPGLVLSNYPLKLPNYRELSLAEIPNIEEQALIILDEAYKYIRSRLSGSSTINNAISDLLFQSRKMSKDFLLTEQLNRTIDVNFRELADFVIKAYHLDENLPTERFQYHLFEGASGNYLGGWEMTRHYAEKNLFPLYDTYHKIQSNKDMGKELILVEPKDIQKELDKVLDELSNEAPLQVWTKPMIKDYCQEKLYPAKFGDMIYARIKRIVATQSYKS
jgi:hypothetical protein